MEWKVSESLSSYVLGGVGCKSDTSLFLLPVGGNACFYYFLFLP